MRIKHVSFFVLLMLGSNLLFAQDTTETFEEIAPERAQFKKGDQALMNYISNEIEIPDKYWETPEGVNIRVWVQFVVNKDGCIKDIDITNKNEVPYDLQYACKKIFEDMDCNLWNPAKVRDQFVSMRFRQPIYIEIPPSKKANRKSRKSKKDKD